MFRGLAHTIFTVSFLRAISFGTRRLTNVEAALALTLFRRLSDVVYQLEWYNDVFPFFGFSSIAVVAYFLVRWNLEKEPLKLKKYFDFALLCCNANVSSKFQEKEKSSRYKNENFCSLNKQPYFLSIKQKNKNKNRNIYYLYATK